MPDDTDDPLLSLVNITHTNVMQESIQQEIEYLHNVRMRDVDEAQQRIVGIIRHLEEEGELVIGKSGEDEIIA